MNHSYQMNGQLYLYTDKGLHICEVISMDIIFPEVNYKSIHGEESKRVCADAPIFKATCSTMCKVSNVHKLTDIGLERNTPSLSRFSEDELLQELMYRTSKTCEKD